MSDLNWADIADIAQIVGSIIAGVGLFLTGVGLIFAGRQVRASYQQLRASRRIAGGDFVLHFDDSIQRYDHIHLALRPGGKWHENAEEIRDQDFPDIERYMGMFERLKLFYDDGLLDLATIDRLYGYRIRNIIANDTIVSRKGLIALRRWDSMSLDKRQSHGWYDFMELWRLLDEYRRQRAVG